MHYDPFNDSRDHNGFLYQKVGSAVTDEFIAELEADAEGIGPSGYAWPERRMFPIFNEKAAAVSAWYIEEQSDTLPSHVQDRVKEALDLYGIDHKIDAPAIKTAAPDEDDFLFPEDRKVHINDAEQVKTAEALLHSEEIRKSMPLATRTYGFQRLQIKAAELGVELESESLPYVGKGRCKVATLREQLTNRRMLLPEGEARRAYLNLDVGLKEAGLEYIDDRKECSGLVDLLHDIDEEAGITRKYAGKKILDPVLAVFNMDKTAADFVDLAGNQVPLEDVAALDPSMVADIVGEEFMEDIQGDDGQVDPQEMAQVMSILPSDMQGEIYERLF